MRKTIFVLLLLALIVPVFAQTNSEELPNIYCINVPVEKIYVTSDGYVVQYRSASSILAIIGIPIEWFGNALHPHGSTGYGSDGANKAAVVRLPSAGDWPTMSIFYVDGAFSHIRLYVHSMKSHPTWGSIRQGTDVSRYFGDRQSFNIQF